MPESVIASIVLNDQTRTDLSACGFRSWVLQRIERPYEVVINVFNDRRALFEELSLGCNPHCRVIINTFDPPDVFNISASNNVGLNATSGKYVFFANADIVHLSDFLDRVTQDMEVHGLHYATGTRENLSPQQTAALPPAKSRTIDDNYDFLRGSERLVPSFHDISPWIARRQTIMEIGGFDARVFCMEDQDMNDRIGHYLRRTGRQQVLYCVTDAAGYHLHHKPSELHAMGPASQAIIVPRRKRLMQNPESTEDVVPTPLESREALIAVLKHSACPEVPLNQAARRVLPWWLHQFLNRLRKANRMLWKGHI